MARYGIQPGQVQRSTRPGTAFNPAGYGVQPGWVQCSTWPGTAAGYDVLPCTRPGTAFNPDGCDVLPHLRPGTVFYPVPGRVWHLTHTATAFNPARYGAQPQPGKVCIHAEHSGGQVMVLSMDGLHSYTTMMIICVQQLI